VQDYTGSLLKNLRGEKKEKSPARNTSSDGVKCSGENLEGYRPPPSRSAATGGGLARSRNFHRVPKLISEKTKEKNKAE